MARVMNPAIRVALVLQAIAAGIAGAQAVFLRYDRPAEETSSAMPRAGAGDRRQGLHGVNYSTAGQVLAESSRRFGWRRQ